MTERPTRKAKKSLERELYDALKLAQKWLANSLPVTEMDGPKPLPIIAAALARAKARLSRDRKARKRA